MLDSTYRDRTRYPYSTEFCVPFQTFCECGKVDPILLSLSIASGMAQVGSTTTSIILDPSTSTLAYNYFINNILQIGNEFVTITSFDPATQIATVSPAFSGVPAVGAVYNIRDGIPSSYGKVATGGTNSTAIVPEVNNYVGSYIVFTTGLNATNPPTARLITAFNPMTQTISFSPAYNNPVLNGDGYEIHSNPIENAQRLHSSVGYSDQKEYVCYEVELLYLILPNETVYSGFGGNINDYPYLLVEFRNVNGGSQYQTMYSNNPNTMTTQFQMPVNDDQITTTFIKLKNNPMRLPLKFKMNTDIKFSVHLPNGELLRFRDDQYSPLAPDPWLQVSALFDFRRM